MKRILETSLAASIGWLARRLPRRMRLALGRYVGGLFFRRDKKHREVTIDNIGRAYGTEKTKAERTALAEAAFRHFGAMFFELLTLGRPGKDKIYELVEFDGVDRYEEARDPEKGVILVTSHYGNWEIHAIAHGFLFGPMNVVAREQENPYLNRRLEEVRMLSGNKVIYKAQALRQTYSLLKEGETVAIVIDQNVHLKDAIFVDFFGRKAATTPIAAWLALRTGAALLPAFSIPLPTGRYRLVYEEPIDCDAYSHLSQDEAIHAITQELTSIQERVIREQPEFWLWMHRRFRTRPRTGDGDGKPSTARTTTDAPASAKAAVGEP